MLPVMAAVMTAFSFMNTFLSLSFLSLEEIGFRPSGIGTGIAAVARLCTRLLRSLMSLNAGNRRFPGTPYDCRNEPYLFAKSGIATILGHIEHKWCQAY
jgi:hypothetical protein